MKSDTPCVHVLRPDRLGIGVNSGTGRLHLCVKTLASVGADELRPGIIKIEDSSI